MKKSVVIIAHNEERYIQNCIESILNQTIKADEIVLICHNCTDRTLVIATKNPAILVVDFKGAPGIIHARIEGIFQASGDVILCLDGDSIANKNWIMVMLNTLEKNENILVGSWVKFKGTLFGRIANLVNKYRCNTFGIDATRWIWGPSFAFWGRDKIRVQDLLTKSAALSTELGLMRNPDDFWLSLFMSQIGNIEVTNKTYVVQNQKETSSLNAIQRNAENIKTGNLIESYISSLKDPLSTGNISLDKNIIRK